MTASSPDPGREILPSPSWRRWLPLSLLWAASAYFWVLPLLRPRGVYLGGHYQLRDIYLGLLLLFPTLGVTAVALAPARLRRPLALRLTTASLAVLLTLFLVDAFHALVLRDAWVSSYWYDVVNIPRGANRLDPELGYVRKPRTRWRGRANEFVRFVDYRTDENGFRNPLGVREADLVFIGDSFTEAAGVQEEDTFVQRAAAGAGLRAVNLGRSGYGPVQERLVLERFALPYRPRVVVWQWFEGNDLTDIRRYAEWRQAPGKSYRPFLRRYLDQTLLNRLLAGTVTEDHPPMPEAVRARLRYTGGEERRIWLHSAYETDQPARFPGEFQEARRLLSEGQALCRARGVRLVVLHVPLMVRVLEPYLEFERPEDRARLLPAGFRDDRNDFRSRLEAHCREIGCPFLDTLPALRRRAAQDNRDLYFPGDQHLDIEGHRIAAEVLLKWLREEGSISPFSTQFPPPGRRN